MITWKLSRDYTGSGVSKGLQRGIMAYHEGELIVREGMGIGICALQSGGLTYFSTIEKVETDADVKKVSYKIDSMLVRSIFGKRSKALTRALEFLTTNVYMKSEKMQKGFFIIGDCLRRLFRIDTAFEKVGCMADVNAVYIMGECDVKVRINCDLKGERSTIFVMNELGGSVFSRALYTGDGVVCNPPSGWQKFKEGYCLYSPEREISFTMIEKRVPENVKSSLYWGREIANGYNWAGFESMLEVKYGRMDGYEYQIEFKKAGDSY